MSRISKEFELNAKGIREKVQWINQYESQGYEVVSETVIPSELNMGAMVCLGIVFFPLLIFQGLYRKPGQVSVAMKKSKD